MIMASFADSGMDRLPFDIAHGMVNPGAPPDAHKSLGWFVPTVMDDIEGGGGKALFASDIQWTEAGAEALQKREFRFFSPAILYDGQTRRIKSLINCALTNLPATKGQKPLVLDDTNNNQENQEMKALFEALSVSDEASAVARVAELSALGKDNEAKIAALSAAVEAKTDEAIKLNAEIAAIQAKHDDELKGSKIASLSAAGKLPPAQKAFAEGLTLEQLDTFAETLSAITTKPVSEPDSGKVETLSDDERQACKLLGVSIEEFTKTKAGK